MAIADGKIYSMTYEHSPNSPHYKNMKIRCVEAFTGEELWTMLGAGSALESGSKAFAVADGYAVYLNAYDMQLYTVGKGPSRMTLSILNNVVSSGSTVTLKILSRTFLQEQNKPSKLIDSLKEFQQFQTKVKVHGWNTYTCKSRVQWTR